jgi:hypothetical protein
VIFNHWTYAPRQANMSVGQHMPSPEYQRFLQSMKIGYEEWHDGTGYDLEALRSLGPEEKQQAEDLLVSRCSDFRGIEALDAMGTDRALDRIEGLLLSHDLELRLNAARVLAKRKRIPSEKVENILLDTLPNVTIGKGLTQAMSLAEAYPSEAVRRRLLYCALKGNDDVRIHAAALAHFLLGGSTMAFDWAHRPLYLRLGSRDRTDRQAGYEELCRSVGVAPEWALGDGPKRQSRKT